jgi:hypothetical protein
MLMRRAWEIEFEEAEAGEVFVRADLRLKAELTHSAVRLISLRYERVGMCVEPVRAGVRQRRGEDLGRLAANGWIVGFSPIMRPRACGSGRAELAANGDGREDDAAARCAPRAATQ